jgi:predicted nucleotidyltransferase
VRLLPKHREIIEERKSIERGELVMNKKMSIKPVLEKFKREIKRIAGDNLRRIILFGSYARDEAKKYSDIDIVLIFQKEPSVEAKNKISEMSNSLSLHYDVVIAEILLTQSEFQKYKTPFLLNVKKEGIAL